MAGTWGWSEEDGGGGSEESEGGELPERRGGFRERARADAMATQILFLRRLPLLLSSSDWLNEDRGRRQAPGSYRLCYYLRSVTGVLNSFLSYSVPPENLSKIRFTVIKQRTAAQHDGKIYTVNDYYYTPRSPIFLKKILTLISG